MKTRILFLHDSPEFSREIEYTVRQLFCSVEGHEFELGFNDENFEADYRISYGDTIPPDVDLSIPRQRILFNRSDRPIPGSLISNRYAHGSRFLYSVEKHKRPDGQFASNQALHFDVLEATFFHLTRYEEWYASDDSLDKHGRLRSEAQFLVKEELHRIPVVDHIRLALLETLGTSISNWPTKHTLTHDIDCLRKFGSNKRIIRAFARTFLKEKNLKKTISLARQFFEFRSTGKDPFDTFEWLFSKNRTKDRVVFFMSGGRTRYDNLYSLSDAEAGEAIGLAISNGYEIGLHPSYVTYKDSGQLAEERAALALGAKTEITSSRQHILRYSVSETPRILQENKIRRDYTLGYADKIGFRCGTGMEFSIFDLDLRQELDVKEIPLVIMDGPLLMEAAYDVDKAKQLLFSFIQANQSGTAITYNFHNSIFADAGVSTNSMKRLYEELLQKINDKS